MNHVITRKQEYINFWFLVKNSLEQAENDSEHKEAFLMNAAIVAIATLEALFNDLAEYYLPDDIFECLDRERSTKECFRKTIEYLTGQNGEFSVQKFGPNSVKVKKININNFFKTSNWDKVCELIRLRNKIVHRKVSDKNWSEEGKIENQGEKWEFDTNTIPTYIGSIENFFGELKNLLKNSVSDYIEERFTSRFDFVKQLICQQ